MVRLGGTTYSRKENDLIEWDDIWTAGSASTDDNWKTGIAKKCQLYRPNCIES